MLETRAIARSFFRVCAILVSPPSSSRRRPFAPVGLAVIGLSSTLLLAGCGQTGPLYLPKEPEAAHRASLPKSLWPFMPSKKKDEAQNQTSPPSDSPAPTPANPAPIQQQP